MTQNISDHQYPLRRGRIMAAVVLGATGAALIAAPTLVHAVVNTAKVTITASDGANTLPNQMVKLTSPDVLQLSQTLPGETVDKPQIAAGADPFQGRTGADGKWSVEVPIDWLTAGGLPVSGTQFNNIEATAFEQNSTRLTFGLNASLSDSFSMIDSKLRPWLADAVQIGDKTALTFELPGSGFTTGEFINKLTSRFEYRSEQTYAAGFKPKSMGQFINGFSNYLKDNGSTFSLGAEYNTSLRDLRRYFSSINYDPLETPGGNWTVSTKYEWGLSEPPQSWSGWADKFHQGFELSNYVRAFPPYEAIPPVSARGLPSQLAGYHPAGAVGTPLNYASDFSNFAYFSSRVGSIGRDLCNTKLPAKRLDGAAPDGAQIAASLPAATVHWN